MKGFRINIIKFLVIAMGVLYLLIPFKEAFIVVLHNISHNFNEDTAVLHHTHNFRMETHHKTRTIYSQEHKIIAFVSYLLSAETSNTKPRKSKIINIDFDKYFCFIRLKLMKINLLNPLLDRIYYRENKTRRFFNKIKVPPKIYILQLC
ncbi:hypothetical protein CLV33_102394 [Jejuia pallidilutea]|uniref:Uncharacterized protein n=1 Tax=Jejuia pallidilutea TaxID=504487 RepID=A0A362XFA0_9FLAO|nr:hypothetical protein [Jejuia pallidilutea]PQV50530.1 hypothetical protein CLV33_102394 [Jejuia pallidilutea]